MSIMELSPCYMRMEDSKARSSRVSSGLRGALRGKSGVEKIHSLIQACSSHLERMHVPLGQNLTAHSAMHL